jgi:DNA polymerase III delta subunit
VSAARKAAEPAPPARLAELERALAGKAPLARGYVVRGEERWFRDAAIALLAEGASRRGLEVARHDTADPDFDLGRLVEDLAAAPMFAPARLVVVRGGGALLKSEGEGKSPFASAASAFLGGASVPGSLAVEAESLRVDSVLAKAVLAAGGPVLTMRKLYDSPPPWERDPDPRRTELAQWLLARARERTLKLSPDEAAYVVAATGNDLGALDGALDELARRGSKGVRESVAWTGGASPFRLAEDLLRGDAAAGLAGIEALFRSGMQEKDGARETKPEALLAVLLGSLRAKLRPTLAAARAAEGGAPFEFRGAPHARAEIEERRPLRTAAAWRSMLDDLAGLERRARTARPPDANDLAVLCLRWRRSEDRIAARRR